jgi:glycosyltransferase involved in cell wall biosynthesis
MVSQYRGDAFGTRVYGGGPPPAVPGVRVLGREALGEQAGGDFERDVKDMVDTIVAEHRREPFDVLHAQYGYPNGWAILLAARELGLPTVVSIQGGDGHWVGSCCATHKVAMQRVLDHANAVLIGSRSFAEEVRERLGTPPLERFTFVPGAVDTTRFRPRPDRGPGAAGDPPTILYHGRVDRRKGALDLLDACALLRGRGVPFRLLVSGIGPDHDEVQGRLLGLGLADVTTMRGYVAYDEVPAVYGEADLFASPTYAEGFSNTILEAMASGLPIVSCHAVGVVDCLRDGENGLLVQPGDVPALAGALERLLADAALRRRLAADALEECRRVYSWTAVGRQIMDVHARVAGTAPDLAWWPDLPREPCRYRDAPHLL